MSYSYEVIAPNSLVKGSVALRVLSIDIRALWQQQLDDLYVSGTRCCN